MIECNDGIVDLDEGLDLRDDFQKELQDSMEYVQTGGRILSAEDVVIRLQIRTRKPFACFRSGSREITQHTRKRAFARCSLDSCYGQNGNG